MKLFKITILIALVFLFNSNLLSQIPKPEDILGFEVGADFRLANYGDINNYFNKLAQASGRITTCTIGESTEGKPILMAVISSEENIKNLEQYRGILKKLSEPGSLTDNEAAELANKGKLFIIIGCSIHASEIGASQMSMELGFKLAAENSEMVKKILDEVVVLLVPSLNPDGLNSVIDWYNENLNTPYEGSGMPWLYHKYAGHDINRDMYMFHLKETHAISNTLYREWQPQIFLSMHQMGSRGSRLFIPPHYDPPNPNLDPILIRETSLLGLSMAAYLDGKGKKGVLTNALFPEWYPGYEDSTPMMHNIICLLSEAASVNIASPIFIRPSELRGGGRGFEKYQKQINFPNPWEGGWWKLRDIVDYDLQACLALIKTGSNETEKFLYNYYKMGKNAINEGKTKPPYAYIIPKDQHDPNTTIEMINKLMKGGVIIHRSVDKFTVDNIEYPKGTFIIFLSQPYRSYIKTLFEKQVYPEKYLYKGGPPEAPYDLSGWTFPVQMGVKVVETDFMFNAQVKILKKTELYNKQQIPEADYGFLLDTRINDTYKVVNKLLEKGCTVSRITKPFSYAHNAFIPGDFLILNKAKTREIISDLIEYCPVPVYGLEQKPESPVINIHKPKIGLYAHWGGNMDEGWTRLLLEKYDFDFNVLRNSEIRTGELRTKYDVILFPDIRSDAVIMNGQSSLPDRFKGGIGEKGLDNLKIFAQTGGTIIFLDTSSEFALKYFDLPVKNILKGIKQEEFFCSGSLLKYRLDTAHPICFGMPEVSHLLFRSSPAFLTVNKKKDESPKQNKNDEFGKIKSGSYPPIKVNAVPASYPPEKLLVSGWIVGEDKLYNTGSIVDVSYGSGKIVLIGFRAQHRTQTYASFKILFNSILYSVSELN